MAIYYKYKDKWNSIQELRQWEKEELRMWVDNDIEAYQQIEKGNYRRALRIAARKAGLYDLPQYIYRELKEELKVRA